MRSWLRATVLTCGAGSREGPARRPGALEAADRFHFRGASWLDPANAGQLSFSLLWACYAIGMVASGLLRKYRPVRLMALAALGGTILKVFLFDLSFLENPYRILSFLVLGAILVAVSFLYQKYRRVLA